MTVLVGVGLVELVQIAGEQVGLERDLWLEFLAGRRFGLETAEGNLCGREESDDLNFQKREFLEVFWNRFYHPFFFKHSRLFDIITAHFAIGP